MVISELEFYRKAAIGAAEDLTYSQDTIYKIKHASTINQISSIMKQARIDSSDRDINYAITSQE